MDTVIESKSIYKTKVSKREQLKERKEKEKLLQDIILSKQELDTTIKNIDFVNDDMLLEHYIFKLKAAGIRYRYLMNKARELGLECYQYSDTFQKVR